MRVLGIVPARGGSKGIPRKNIRLLGGKPLLQYTAEAAKQATRLERTLLSTDDREIAELGERLGLWVPFLRPPELARDDTPTLDVLLHLVEWLHQNGMGYDAYCLLQPTTPFRTVQEIDAAVELLAQSDADAVVSVIPVPKHYHPAWQMKIAGDGALVLWNDGSLNHIVTRRQDLSQTYIRSGSIYVMRDATLREKKSLYGDKCLPFLVSTDRHINLDMLDDWARAEEMLARV